MLKEKRGNRTWGMFTLSDKKRIFKGRKQTNNQRSEKWEKTKRVRHHEEGMGQPQTAGRQLTKQRSPQSACHESRISAPPSPARHTHYDAEAFRDKQDKW